MAEESVQRRLAAILATDMAGFSRLMGLDEDATITRQKAHRKELFDPTIALHHGRIVKATGDGLLVEFNSVLDAVRCAAEVQHMVAQREAGEPEDRRMLYRMGINLGDIVIDGDDIFGDGVNIAARLGGLAESGGICISDTVRQSIEGKIDLAFDDLGGQVVKNITKLVHVWKWRTDGATETMAAQPSSAMEQEIRFCLAPDGVQIGYSTVGEGPPLVKAPHWLSHLEYDWQSPIWRHVLREFCRDHTLVRFDQRGNGLSDWDVEDISFDAFVGDLETVVDTLGLERFPLLGISQGAAISVAYAVKHPERVSHLVLYGGYSRGRNVRGDETAREKAEAERTLIRHGWGQDNPSYRQIFTTRFVPGGTQEQMDWFNEMERISASPDNAVRLFDAIGDIEISDLLAKVTTPALVLHCRGDAMAPFNEGRRLAAMIPNARFVALEGDNHLILAHEPAWPRFLSEVRSFLAL